MLRVLPNCQYAEPVLFCILIHDDIRKTGLGEKADKLAPIENPHPINDRKPFVGLGIFSVHGAAVAVRAGLGGNVFLTLLVGMLTGVGGGVLRDLCCMERPYIFTKHIYACASLAGAAACMLLWSAGENLALLTGCALTVVLRLCAAVFRWSLPKA